MQKITIIVGLDWDKDGQRLYAPQINEGIDNFKKKVTALCGGCTLVNSNGTYTHPAGTIAVERSIMFIVYCSGLDVLNLRTLALLLRDDLNQESVVFEQQEVEWELI